METAKKTTRKTKRAKTTVSKSGVGVSLKLPANLNKAIGKAIAKQGFTTYGIFVAG